MKQVYAGIVLAGGSSSRMGQDKAWLLYQGKPFIQHAIDALTPHCSQLFISSKDASYGSLGVKQIPDLLPGLGPAGALLSCLSAVENDLLMVVPCDLPLVTHSVLNHLVADSNEFDAVVAKVNGRLIPVCGVYHRSALEVLSEEVGAGRLKLQGILEGLKVQVVDFDALGLKNRFFNVNSFGDYQLLQGFSQ
jgi:molybdopterin-guanine dinucleotide biosynthesis protein A